MKYIITEAFGKYADDSAVGKVHIQGPGDRYACGLADEDYKAKETNKPVTCQTCLDMLKWAKSVSKIKRKPL